MKETELYHYGMPRRSGRYPYGSGERPFQDRLGSLSERRKEKAEVNRKKNIAEGKERLSNRIKRANQLADRLSKKLGWKNTIKAGEANKRVKDIKEVSREIMNDEKRVEALGKHTRNVRKGIAASTLASMAAVGGIGSAYVLSAGSAGLLALPLVGAAGVYKIGDEWMKKTFY